MDRPLQTQQDSIRLALYQEPEASLPGGVWGGRLGQAYINCFPIVYKNTITGETETVVVKRQGTAAIADLGIGSVGSASTNMVCIANMVMTQLYDVYVAAFFDSSTSKILIIQYRPITGSGGTVKIGEISTCSVNDQVFITEGTNGDTLLPSIGVSYLKADKSSGTGYYAASAAGVFGAASLVTITHASFPSNLATPRIITGPFQYMNGHWYIMTIDGFIYMSSLTSAGNPDVSTWNTNATVTASQYPDGGIGVFRYKHHLLAFGKDSVEFFNDASNPPPGSTLERTDQAFIKFGALNAKMIQNFDDTIYWVAYGSNDSFGVWKMTGYAPEKISDLKIDQNILNTLSSNSDNFINNMQCVVLAGRKHLVLNGIPYTCAVDLFNSNSISSADTYSVISAVTTRAGSIAYSLEDKIWWGLNLLSEYYQAFPIFTTSYNATSQLGNYRQYFFQQPQAANNGDDVSSTRVLYFRQTISNDGQYVDANPLGFTTSSPIGMVVCLPPYWFQTERRKRVNKIKAIIDGFTVGSGDSSIYALYFVTLPNNVFDPTGNSYLARRLVIPTSNQRYTTNNWGMHRVINLSLIAVTSDDMRIRAVELDIAQGTN